MSAASPTLSNALPTRPVRPDKVPLRRFLATTLAAWFVFVAIDFTAHATLLSSFWQQELVALKSREQLFRLIPFGYASFLVLTLVVGWLLVRLGGADGIPRNGLVFGATFGAFFAVSTFLGWYSAIALPTSFILWISIVYWIELAAVGWAYGYLLFCPRFARRVLAPVALGISVLASGVAIQILAQLGDAH